MLRLNEIGGEPLTVEASNDESLPRSSAVFSGNQIELCLDIGLELGVANEYISKDTRNTERRILVALAFEDREHFKVEYVLRNVVKVVRVLFSQAILAFVLRLRCIKAGERSLDIFCKVHLVREVECFFFLHVLNHIDERLVLGGWSTNAIFSYWHEHKFFDSVNVAFHNLADDGGFLDYYEVRMGLELNVAEHAVNILGLGCATLERSVFTVRVPALRSVELIKLELVLSREYSEQDLISH